MTRLENDLLAALNQAAAALAVISNQIGAKHSGLADADNLQSVRGFALECFHEARAAAIKANADYERSIDSYIKEIGRI